MNYEKIYFQLINKPRTELSTFEIHHIIPRCLGGSDNEENLCKLSPREHYIAHALLCKIYPNNRKIAYAFHMMNVSSSNHKRSFNSKLYEYFKCKLKTSMDISHREAISKALSGIPKSESHKKRLSIANLGKKTSEETKRKQSIAGKTRTRSKDEYASRIGRTRPDSYKNHMKVAMKGKHKGKKKYNDGIKEYLCFPEQANPEWKLGRL